MIVVDPSEMTHDSRVEDLVDRGPVVTAALGLPADACVWDSSFYRRYVSGTSEVRKALIMSLPGLEPLPAESTYAVCPPSTTSVVPVIKDEASDAR